jgi:phage terminase Nu1 subunit (DNA packaging protein)
MATLVDLGGLSPVRQANKAQLAEFFDVSVKTVDNWVRRGCPVVKRGGKSEPWIFDALAVAEWRYTREGGESEVDPERMDPQDRKAWYESEAKRRDLEERDRELLRASEVEEVLAVAWSGLSQDLQAIPDNLERRFGITADVAEKVEMGIFEAMDAAADRLQSISLVDQ